MSITFQFSNNKSREDPLFFRKSRVGPPGRPSLRPITEETDETDKNPKMHKGIVVEIKGRFDQGFQEKCWKKYVNCLIRVWRLFALPKQKWNSDLNNKDFQSLIENIKSKACRFKKLLPPQKISKKVLVLDLDQTLISTTFNRPQRFDFQVEFKLQGRNTRGYSVKRFGLDIFLYEMAQLYELVMFTACNKDYACKVLEKIDPEGLITHRLFREDGITVNGNTFLKNIEVLGRDPHNIIIVDDNRFSGMLQPDNFYQIETFKGHEKDKKLLHLANFLKFVHKLQRVTPINETRAAFDALQITIDRSQQQISELEKPHLSGFSREFRSHLQKKSSIDTQICSTEFQSEGETTVTNLIKTL